MSRRTRPALAVAAVVLALAMAACSGENGDEVASAGDATGTATEEVSEAEALQAFAECMREQGVDMPDPDPEGGIEGMVDILRDHPDEVDACRDELPDGGEAAELDPEQQAQIQEFAQCMRDNGVDMPDPDPNGQPNFDTELMNDPDFDAAMEACQDLLAGIRGN